MRYLPVTAVLLLGALSLQAEDKWIRLSTPNFEVYTSQSEKKARETALYFEQLREFFLSYWRTKADPGTPVRIILFANEKQYEPFRPHKQAAGYFQHGIDRDWIVIGGNQQGWERIICHEYTHLMVKQAGISLPIWLNEGLAEIYSTFKPVSGKVQVGDLIPGHFQALQSGWIPVPRLLEVRHSDPEYNGTKTHEFYAGAWGLTHMLLLGADNHQAYVAFLNKLVGGMPLDEALSTTSLSAKRLDSDLRVYLKRNDRFYAGLIPFKSERSNASWTTAPVTATELDATLALLQLQMRLKPEDAKTRLTRLDQSDWHSQEALAYSAWQTGEIATARTHFQKAIELGATSSKLYYDAARASMYSGDRSAASLDYLKKAVALYPEWTDAKLQLLEQFVFLRQYGAANSLSTEFKSISPTKASRLFRSMAYFQTALNAHSLAEIARKRAREFARTDFDRAECDRLEQFLTRVAAANDANERAESIGREMRAIRERADAEEGAGYGDGLKLQSDAPPPKIRRTAAASDDAPAPRLAAPELILPEGSIPFRGTLANIDCADGKAIVHLKAESGEVLELQISDPTKVNNYRVEVGMKSPTLDLICGEQARKVLIHYTPAFPGQKRGELNAIEYK